MTATLARIPTGGENVSNTAYLNGLVVLVSIALVLAACGGGATPTTAPAQPTAATQPTVPANPRRPCHRPPYLQPTDVPAKAEPTVLHFGWLGKPDTLNPAYAFLVESTTILDLVYNTLLRLDQSGQVRGRSGQRVERV